MEREKWNKIRVDKLFIKTPPHLERDKCRKEKGWDENILVKEGKRKGSKKAKQEDRQIEILDLEQKKQERPGGGWLAGLYVVCG